MRRLVDEPTLRRFMQALGEEAEKDVRLYFTGGATAVLLGWRGSTVTVDIKIDPETDRLFRALPQLKEKLSINIELASPDHFIPELSGWQERSLFVAREGRLSFYHYDLYAQALSKVERGHAQDLSDVRQMIERGFVDPAELLLRFQEIEPRLYRYPAIDGPSFRRAVEEMARQGGAGGGAPVYSLLRARSVSSEGRSVSSDFRSVSSDFPCVSSDFRSVSGDFPCVSSDFRSVSGNFRSVSSDFRSVSGRRWRHYGFARDTRTQAGDTTRLSRRWNRRLRRYGQVP